jgi:hypothetical protein
VETEYEVWPDNWDALNLFIACATQWRVSMAGPTGLDYAAVVALMPLYATPGRDVMDRVRACEAAVLGEMKKERDRDGKATG